MTDLFRGLEKGGVLSAIGVAPGAQAFLTAAIRQRFPNRTLVFVAEGLKAQESIHQDLQTWLRLVGRLGEGDSLRAGHHTQTETADALFYAGWDVYPHESKLPHVDVISDRLQTLAALLEEGSSPVIVATVAGLMQKTFRPDTLRERIRRFKRGTQMDPQEIAAWLLEQGYEAEAQVNHKGEFSIRGGILDIFPPTASWPVRLEFFGDELDSLRSFDPITQISREAVGEAVIPPAGELGLLKRGSERPAGTLFDYLGPNPIFVLSNGAVLDERAAEYASNIPANDQFHLAWTEVKKRMREENVSVVDLSEPDETTDSLGFQTLETFRPILERAPEPHIAELQRREFFNQMHRWLRQNYRVFIFCNNEGERERFREIWEEYGLGHIPKDSKETAPTDAEHRWPTLVIGTLSRGFLHEESNLAVITDAEIFGRYKVQRPRRLKAAHAQTSRSLLDIDFTDLEEGDYVVHVQHGIGRYVGMGVLPTGSGTKPLEKSAPALESGQECLVIEYAATDPQQPAPKLYVPVSEAHLVSKYVGAGKARPPLNTLGGTRWIKTKEAAERAVRDVAGELLAIQAARDSEAGHAFPPDVPWQGEFESAFVFEETPDQFQAIQATKADMERAKPMDRLICGDVGFGKTEVAIRAAFKSVMGGKQVAVLVPTTVLAQQHFNTFRERMADYPIRIELLSRFRKPREQKRVLQDLTSGSVDIVIGTHRLVQDDVSFKDLGLVVIDEEQRFGVMHKEKFKLLRRLVDVLTLSATPIPRTLYLALTGARDMSTIETPPQDRLPVDTIVAQYDERLIRDAIQHEMNRQGQVFYLHNRVFDIDEVATKLRTLLPKARILVGHGQMDSDELEEVMTKFVNGEADVLLSTTIIESGLDIPNANTIIIDRADRFGLSDLYQLRGRVGRYKHQAYAYLLLPRHAGLLTDARKRISAIKQYSSLGSGFKIAMRDLEIRGAGNLLGAQQSGHITAVGFDLYCQLLKQSISVIKGEKVPERVDVQARLDFIDQQALEGDGGEKTCEAETASAYLPVNYINDSHHRIQMYRKFAETMDIPSLEILKRELRDRFGALPVPVEMLLAVTELRILAAKAGISAIETKEDKLMMTRNGELMTVDGKFPRLKRKSAKARLNEIRKLLLSLALPREVGMPSRLRSVA